MQLVLDTDVMVAAIRSNAGASHQLLLAGLHQRCRLLVSTPLLLQYQAVMTRPEHLEAADLTVQEVTTLLDTVAMVARPVTLAFLWRPTLRDPDDDMVLETALNGAAELLVTFNLRDFAAGVDRFDMPLATPGETLRRLGG